MNIMQRTVRENLSRGPSLGNFRALLDSTLSLLSPVVAGRKNQSSYNEKHSMCDLFSAQKSMMSMLRVCALFAALSFMLPLYAAAADFSTTPAVIDGKGKVREILRYTIIAENTTEHLVSLYPWVTDVDNATGQSGESDLGGAANNDVATSLARWIEVTRGVVDLLPGEKREIPVLVRINLNAPPGIYHAAIHFSAGGNRVEAEANTSGTAETFINIEVLEDKNVRLQLGGFLAEKDFFISDEAAFSYSVENIGNRGVVPGGRVRIFNRNGEEVAALEANTVGKKIEPSEKAQLAAVWTANGEFGRYKAMLDLEYGDRGTIQDTVFFWLLPWGRMLSYFLTLAMLSVVIALLIHSRMASVPQRADEDAPLSLAERVRLHQKKTRERGQKVHHRMREHDRAAAAPMRNEMQTPALSGHRIALSARPKPPVDPLHIINLKKTRTER